ncbi:hypothetical protein BDZ90DRAFT_166687 [Jaminaea rosea]|uniref:Uncharacterized protein n=1 Tax=Jaminaea rosea TaxID=1569628 RepID=A0A316URI4_9BASI|nr:hypothetical protein BDZ90DRAFT_166687 [Jaminaea rosea]PWN27584.1 hypothetical protein BDZ90DRAFT_166687 [Jaminaea rosea]
MLLPSLTAPVLALLTLITATSAYTITFDNTCKHAGVETTIKIVGFGGKPLPSGTSTFAAPATVDFKSPWGTFGASLSLDSTSLSTSLSPPPVSPFYFRGSLAIENEETTTALECTKKHPGDCKSRISIQNGNKQSRLGLIVSPRASSGPIAQLTSATYLPRLLSAI